MSDYVAGLCWIMKQVYVRLCGSSVSDYVAVLYQIWQVRVRLCGSFVSYYVAVLCWIMWQFCAHLCDRYDLDFVTSLLDYVTGLCWFMWQFYVGVCDRSFRM